jgi:hypothetical protein
MEQTKEQLIAFIGQLPATEEEKKGLLATLEEEDGIESIKVILRAALEESALKTSFKENVIAAEEGFNEDLVAIEKDAVGLRNDVSKSLDAERLQAIKDQL